MSFDSEVSLGYIHVGLQYMYIRANCDAISNLSMFTHKSLQVKSSQFLLYLLCKWQDFLLIFFWLGAACDDFEIN